MKITKLHIDDFGGLHDLDYSFTDGLNCIIEENGWGKTTFLEFIAAMFYGFPDKKDRERLYPWQGGNFGGWLEFAGASGNEYRVTRKFAVKAVKATPDYFELREARSNLISSKYSERIGEELFGIDKAGYLNTAYISVSGCGLTVTDGITAKIASAYEGMSANDLGVYEKAYRNLEKSLGSLNGPKAGKRKKLSEEIYFLENEVKSENDLLNNLQQSNSRCIELQKEKGQIEEELIRLREESETVGRFELVAEKKRSYEYRRKELERLASELEEKRKRLNQGKGMPVLFALVNAAIVLLNAVSFAVNSFSGKAVNIIIPVVSAVILFLIYIVFFTHRGQTKRYKKEFDETEGKHRELTDSFEQYCEENPEVLEKQPVSPRSIMSVREDIRGREKRLAEISRLIIPLEGSIDETEQKLDEIKDKKGLIDGRKSELREVDQKIAYSEKALEYLKKARDNMNLRYLEAVRDGFDEYFESFIGREPSEYHMDSRLELTYEKNGEQRNTETLSSGSKDIISLCRRFAFIDSMYGEERPVLLLDDPFVWLDDKNIEPAFKILEALTKKYQIVYISCNSARNP